MKENKIKRVNFLAGYFPPFFSQGEREFCYVILGVALVCLPILIYLYAEKVFWKIIEIKHSLRIKDISKSSSVNFSEKPRDGEKIEIPQNTEESDGNSFGDTPGNFLFLAYGIDSQLKLIEKEIGKGKGNFEIKDKKKDAEKAVRNEVLTRNGRKKIEFIFWLRGMIERGGAENLSKKTLRVGVCLAWELHQELNSYLRQMV